MSQVVTGGGGGGGGRERVVSIQGGGKKGSRWAEMCWRDLNTVWPASGTGYNSL